MIDKRTKKIIKEFEADEREKEKRYRELVEKYLKEPYELLPDALENLEFVKTRSKEYAKGCKAEVKSEVSYENYTATVTVTLPFLIFASREYKLLEEMKDKINRILLFPKRGGLDIIFEVSYFSDKPSPAARATKEVYFGE